jgi:AAA family ATP:ADP antiporter
MRKGWKFAASVTPICAFIGSVLFFSFISFGEYFEGVSDYFNTTPLFMGVMFGLINVMFIKSAKYTLFDPTKEIAYIPLDDESKVRGKAAVDGVGARLGKSLGSLILTTWLVPFVGDGKIENVKQYILFMLFFIIIIWIISINRLSVMFNKISDKKE